jgi:uncharacterized protein YbjT (DUF2867 family)
MFLVTGATGNVGGALVQALAGAGERVRALVRGGKEHTPPAGVELVVGDLDRPETLSSAFAGVSGVFLLPGFQDMPGVLAQARRAGVERVVLLSGASADGGDMTNAISRYMMVSEAAVREGGVPWTIVRSVSFMTNTLEWAPQLRAGDVVRAPFAGVRLAMIDPNDIAAAAAVTLTSAGHEKRHYKVTGPQSLLPADRVRILASVLGRDLRFEGQPDAEARAEMSRTMPAKYVDATFRFFADGTLDESKVLPTVQQLTGRPPRTFEQWARAHVDAFASR